MLRLIGAGRFSEGGCDEVPALSRVLHSPALFLARRVGFPHGQPQTEILNMQALTKYDAARYALSIAVEVDEVKDIRDKAEAMAAYARQAKDTELVQWATEIKVRAERRAGQMLAEMPKAVGTKGQFAGGHTMVPPAAEAKTLADIGITKNESSRWQKLAAVTDTQFEQAVSAAKEVAGEVTTAAMLRAAKACDPPKPAVAPKPVTPAPVAEPESEAPPEYTELDAAHDQISELQSELVVARMGNASEEEKQQAAGLISELRAEIKTLSATLAAVQLSRDSLMEERAQMLRQMKAQRSEIDRLKAKK